jgi:Flp pilus assembly protein CpaB
MSQPPFPGQQPPFGGPSPFPGAPGMGSPIPGPSDIPSAAKNKKGKKDTDAKNGKGTPTNRSGRTFKIMAGAAVAVFAGAMLFLNTPEASVYVVKAKGNIGALATVDQAQLEAVKVTPEGLEAGAVTADSAEKALAEAVKVINGRTTQYPIFSGAQLHQEMFSKTEVQLDSSLQADERLFSVNATVSGAVAGTIKPGDHVDVVAVTTNGDSAATVVAYDVTVAAVTVSEQQINSVAGSQTGEGKDQNPQDLLPGNPIPGIYTLRIKQDQMTTLAAADGGTDLYLAYRAPGAKTAAVTGVSVPCLLSNGVDPATNKPSNPVCR